MKALCQSGVVLFLDRPLEKILAEGTEQEDNTRPLLSKDRKTEFDSVIKISERGVL